jgi:hypothetical protein
MAKLFDRFEKALFNVLNSAFGEQQLAVWTSKDLSTSYTGPVLFNNPTAKESLDQISFSDTDAWMEYLSPAFDGLKYFVDSNSREIVNINGADYIVTLVQRLQDGNNYKAYLQAISDGYGPKNQ